MTRRSQTQIPDLIDLLLHVKGHDVNSEFSGNRLNRLPPFDLAPPVHLAGSRRQMKYVSNAALLAISIQPNKKLPYSVKCIRVFVDIKPWKINPF